MVSVKKSSLLIHSTNTVMPGSTQLLMSLLPELEKESKFDHLSILLPDKGDLTSYQKKSDHSTLKFYKRILPNSISRVFECLFPSKDMLQYEVILVMGDIPIRLKQPQVLFLQNSNLTKQWNPLKSSDSLKYWISTLLIRFNLKFVSNVIVQTEVMRKKVVGMYPMVAGRVKVIPQPVPEWMISHLGNAGPVSPSYQHDKIKKEGLTLFYPAAGYPHKNHQILGKIQNEVKGNRCINKVLLTLDQHQLDLKPKPWIEFVGSLDSDEMLKTYSLVDGLLFLSNEESYGFPLVEAMVMGLPIIAPELDYAKVLSGEQAIYFKPDDLTSLQNAILHLKEKLLNGWIPDYSSQINTLPKTWKQTAQSFLKVVDESMN